MEVAIYSYEKFKARAVDDEENHSRAIVLDLEKGGALWLFVNDEAQANQIRRALNQLYPHWQATNAAEDDYADAHANEQAANQATPADIAKALHHTAAASGIVAAHNVAAVDMVAKACGLPPLSTL